jgi:hypothetical protein
MVNWNSDGDSPRAGLHDMALRGAIGGLTTSSRYDPRDITAPARKGFAAKFYEGIPLDLPEEERERRAYKNMQKHMRQLALKSAQARRAGVGRKAVGGKK